MADDTEAVTLKGDEILQKLQRDVNCLSDDNKTTRRRAIEKIKNEIISLSSPILHYVLNTSLIKPILKLISDPGEKCREISINILSEAFSVLQDPTHFMPLIIPIIVARLGTVDITEPSEEIRLSLVQLLVKLLIVCGRGFGPYVHDMVTILRYTLIDPYHEVKKESCTCVVKLSSCVPGHLFSQESEILVKSLLSSLSHQHSKVRIAALKALGCAILYGTASPINDCLSILAQRVCDSNPSVRMNCVNVLGEWLLELPDRYSYHHKLIPLLLTGLHDEVTEIKETVHKLWTQIGVKYEQENENDLKDKMDFARIKEPFPLLEYPRPVLGCRVLVYRNFSKILPAILHDLSDWTLTSRIKSSQLLYTLLYHTEDTVTQHIQSVLGGLYRACQDEEKQVIKWACQSARVIGYYVPSEIWCHLVLPAVRVSGGVSGGGASVPIGPVQCSGCLMTLHNLILGNESLPYTQLKDITLCIGEPVLSCTSNIELLDQLLHCVYSVIRVCANDEVTSLSLHLFTTLLRLYPSLPNAVNGIELLADKQQLINISQLYSLHAVPIMDIIKVDYMNWSLTSPNYLLFTSYITGASIDNETVLYDIIAIITHYTVNTEQIPELRLKFITILIQYVLSNTLHSSCVPVIIRDIIIPCCVWKAGRVAATIRTAALTGTQLLLDQTHDTVLLMDELLPQVVSCLDDDNYSTRNISCKVIEKMLSLKIFTVERLHQLYPHLFKRLDDSCDDIRLLMANTLLTYYNSFPTLYDSDLYKGHIEVMYSTLLIHMDDPSQDMQDCIVNVLKISSKLNSTLLMDMTLNVKSKHRTTKYCDELIEYINHRS